MELVISIAGKAVGRWKIVHQISAQGRNYAGESGTSLVLEEAQFYGLQLSDAPEDQDYTLSIGDMGLEEILGRPGEAGAECGMRFGGNILWADHNYFESARGNTNIRLFERQKGASVYKEIFSETVHVNPGKIGEQRYECMTEDLRQLCGDLITDLYGKSTVQYHLQSFPAGFSVRSNEMELKAVDETWSELRRLVLKMARSPLKKMKALRKTVRYWGDRPLSAFAARRLALRGIIAGSNRYSRPLDVVTFHPVESNNVAENQILLSFLLLLMNRLIQCSAAVEEEIQLIRGERKFRDMKTGGSDKTLFETFDIPKINRLTEFKDKASRLYGEILKATEIPMFEGVEPRFRAPDRNCFGQNTTYRRIRNLIMRFLQNGACWLAESGEKESRKLTSRLYEHWVFMKVVDAFRRQGLNLENWESVMDRKRETHFKIDFYRGMGFSARLAPETEVLIRYEPWILSEKKAESENETVYRGGTSEVPWCPDILIEYREVDSLGSCHTIYAVVIDCKYTGSVRPHHWDTVGKYLQIRSLKARRQVVKQLWIAYPGKAGEITCQDPAIRFGHNGPTCPPDEAIMGVIGAIPESIKDAPDTSQISGVNTVFSNFASGIISYISANY